MVPQRRSSLTPIEPSSSGYVSRESPSGEFLDVPATVVCARCGDVDCTGCEHEQSRSGVVAIIAWEKPALPATSRLWATARATTRDAEIFFELLPDGPILPALVFATICELLASAAMLLLVVPVAAVVAPEWLKHLVLDPTARDLALRVTMLGVPAFATLLVIAHAAHGLSVDIGAKRVGARSSRSRALRFGLYACGWDLVMGPLGAVLVAFKEGIGAGLGVFALASSGLPTRATTAFLRGSYDLRGELARKALSASYVGAVVATLLGTFVTLAAIVALVLA